MCKFPAQNAHYLAEFWPLGLYGNVAGFTSVAGSVAVSLDFHNSVTIFVTSPDFLGSVTGSAVVSLDFHGCVAGFVAAPLDLCSSVTRSAVASQDPHGSIFGSAVGSPDLQ